RWDMHSWGHAGAYGVDDRPCPLGDARCRLPTEGMVAAGRMAELLGEVGQHRLEHPRIHRGRRLAVHEDGKLERHRLSPAHVVEANAASGTKPSEVSSASVMVSSMRLMLAWIFWTGRRRLHREYCGQSSPSVMQLTILMGPSSARSTCPTVMASGRRVSS